MKDELREKFKILRKYFSGVRREEADRAIAECFMSAFGRYESFFIYNSFGTEADTKGLISLLLSEGKQVFLPRVEGKEIVPVPYGPCSAGAYGIQEPCGKAYEGTADVTVVPLLAVNSKGYRLGYGGGFYDRYLKGAQTVKAGLGYGFQLTDQFTEDEWDEPLDLFLCERGIYHFGR